MSEAALVMFCSSLPQRTKPHSAGPTPCATASTLSLRQRTVLTHSCHP